MTRLAGRRRSMIWGTSRLGVGVAPAALFVAGLTAVGAACGGASQVTLSPGDGSPPAASIEASAPIRSPSLAVASGSPALTPTPPTGGPAAATPSPPLSPSTSPSAFDLHWRRQAADFGEQVDIH